MSASRDPTTSSFDHAGMLRWFFNVGACPATLLPFAPLGIVTALHARGSLPRGFRRERRQDLCNALLPCVGPLTEWADGEPAAEARALRHLKDVEGFRQANAWHFNGGKRGEYMDTRASPSGYGFDARGFLTKSAIIVRPPFGIVPGKRSGGSGDDGGDLPPAAA